MGLWPNRKAWPSFTISLTYVYSRSPCYTFGFALANGKTQVPSRSLVLTADVITVLTSWPDFQITRKTFKATSNSDKNYGNQLTLPFMDGSRLFAISGLFWKSRFRCTRTACFYYSMYFLVYLWVPYKLSGNAFHGRCTGMIDVQLFMNSRFTSLHVCSINNALIEQ